MDVLLSLASQLMRRAEVRSKVSTERVRAACVIQAAWRSFQTRRRVKSLNRAVSTLQKRYRARRRRLQEQKEAQRWEEQLRYQVRPYLQECERRAAVVIQSVYRGFRERRRYNDSLRDALRESQRQQCAARTLQRAAESFLSPSASIAARARDTHNATLQANRLPWWRTLGEMHTGEEASPAHLQELEAVFGGLFIGGSAVVRGGTEVDGLKV
ncbi:hypothetical protein GOODEAATRI_002724 [Goodea atripinnis]|uniref:Uncharacterized protein n=1 Tax=Goodea atripinnis TaxID=208336 RepID=A0ABV0PUP7_9TELE